MKLFVRSLCFSAAFVTGYIGLMIVMDQFGAFELLGRRTFEMISAPVEYPLMIYRSLYPVRSASLWPLVWGIGGNTLIYSAPVYLYLRLRPRKELP